MLVSLNSLKYFMLLGAPTLDEAENLSEETANVDDLMTSQYDVIIDDDDDNEDDVEQELDEGRMFLSEL